MSKFKVGDLVIPNMGPHKGKEHKIIGIKDGKYNITPTKIMPRKIKYKLGAAAAKEDQITMAEETINEGLKDIAKIISKQFGSKVRLVTLSPDQVELLAMKSDSMSTGLFIANHMSISDKDAMRIVQRLETAFKKDTSRRNLKAVADVIRRSFDHGTQTSVLGYTNTRNESYDGRTRDGKKFVERMNKRAEVIKAAKESAAKKAKGDEGDKLIKGAAEAGKNISLTIEDDLKEAASLKKVPAAVMKNLGGADKKQLAKILDDKADLSDKASEKLYDKLFDYYSTNGMPYGTASARDGDPYEWIIDQIS